MSSNRVKYLELVVKDTFGANRTYLSQIFLYADEKQKVKSATKYAAMQLRKSVSQTTSLTSSIKKAPPHDEPTV